ncbi:uncharacterized protein LOC105262557 [Musca domestica]|uniref:Uncharacterized protein LOC105262557 n=1 Tax=Musca domestica TaxID=7370 RepID=A0A1I8NJA6_MUSDO|nr:uncharacterized protein LOC105262557 [Musca domestica]
MPITLFHVHGIIEGVLCLFLSLIMILFQAEMIKYVPENNIHPHIALILAAVILSATSGLMIIGIIKKRPLFLLPWIIFMILVSAVHIIFLIIACMQLFSFHYKGWIIFLIVTGFNIKIIFPVIGIYLELRDEGGNKLDAISVE